jgi:hypothetical protein
VDEELEGFTVFSVVTGDEDADDVFFFNEEDEVVVG